MSIYIHSNTEAGLLYVDSDKELSSPHVEEAECPLLCVKALENGGKQYVFDASALSKWSPDTPVLYKFKAGQDTIRFGFSELRPEGNRALLLNGSPCYMRGYIRGITAHEHPNMTGKTLKDAAIKNIKQAKKYGFNLVRFHSTIPTPEFVEAADELGMFIHIEIGFAYEMNEKAEKKNLSMDNKNWTETILRYRNSPSIAIFCIGNEMHNSGHYPQVKELVAQGRRLAPGKLIMDNSGWGEFDRQTADVYSQHIAYFFPYKHHGDMFQREDPWLINGSAYDVQIDTEIVADNAKGTVHRTVVPAKPTLAHEAVHYIEIPDYEALNRKFDDFCAQVGPEYLKENGIEKPRFMTELPKLIKRKGLTEKMPDYIKASEKMKMRGIKTFLEACRRSSLCGFEMLQFADCLKYENKNGIVDCFDDDKYIPADWMMQFNGNAALLAKFEKETFTYGEPIHVDILVSDFLQEPSCTSCTLTLKLSCENGEAKTLYDGVDVTLVGGLQKIVEATFSPTASCEAHQYTLYAEMTIPNGVRLTNSWDFWCYPCPETLHELPESHLKDHGALQAFLNAQNAVIRDDAVIEDILDDSVLDELAAGKHVYLFYHRDTPGQKYVLPGALERLKPCIWDRGSDLGGIVYSQAVQKAMASGRYFDLNWYELLNGGFKICLDHFPVPVEEFICGVDKPVRDRMKGLVSGIKDFIDDDTLRNFSHLFSVKVGTGLLTVCTLQFEKTDDPVVWNFLSCLFAKRDAWNTVKAISLEAFKEFLVAQTAAGPVKEDVMNHFWEIDNKLVEDTLFWEEANLDLTKIQ
ncbi:MAG: hypothetical protein J6X55_05860 [Victivallales bacterium]|nr:hypothetical protein [Victivallales bacterium]